MTKKEADALISYIEFLAALTEDHELMNRPPGTTAGDWTASAFLICRPDKDNINLPKDYQI